MGARTRRFTSLASGSGKATAVVVCAVMLLAGCGGSGGSATEAGAPVIRGDVAGDSASTVVVPGSLIPVVPNPEVNGNNSSLESYAERGESSDGAIPFESNITLPPEWDPVAETWSSTVSVPGTPPAPTVVAGTAKVTATVAGGTSGGTPASYTVTAYTGTGTGTGTVAGTCTVTGASGFCDVTALTAGSTYTVKAIAKNTAGDSGESGASSPVTLAAPLRTVTFNANGGEKSMDVQTASGTAPLRTNAFIKTGFVFDGWSTTVNGDKAYGDGVDYKFAENVTLYARWVAAPSSVATQAATVPGAPGLTALSRRSKTEVWVTFSAPSSDGGEPITGYTVTAKGPNGGTLTQSFPAQAGKVPVGPLKQNGFYTFTVRAVNSVGTSKPSIATRYLNLG